jgi:hypothetical protein
MVNSPTARAKKRNFRYGKKKTKGTIVQFNARKQQTESLVEPDLDIIPQAEAAREKTALNSLGNINSGEVLNSNNTADCTIVEVESSTSSSCENILPAHDMDPCEHNSPIKKRKTYNNDKARTDTDIPQVYERHFVNGLRLVNIEYFWMMLIKIAMHYSCQSCTFDCLQIYKEAKYGLNTLFKIQCKACNATFDLYTCENPFDEKKYLGGINYAAVLAITNIGSGFRHLQEFFTIMNVPCMTSSTYEKYQRKLLEHWNRAAEKVMKNAVLEEIIEAIKTGNVMVMKDGRRVSLITVIVDACWAKRSYRVNYSSLSGAASIVGAFTKKVLWIGTYTNLI